MGPHRPVELAYDQRMTEQKTSATAGLAGMYLLVIGVVLLVVGVLVWGAGGQPLIPLALGVLMLLAWLIIKAAKS